MVQAALALCEHGFDISDDAIMQGIAAARNPARIEVLQRRPLVILDGMHNPDSARALADVLRAGRVQGPDGGDGRFAGQRGGRNAARLSPHLARSMPCSRHRRAPYRPGSWPRQQGRCAGRFPCGRTCRLPCRTRCAPARAACSSAAACTWRPRCAPCSFPRRCGAL